MPKRQTSAFTAEHIAEFNRIQALRPVILHRFGDLLEVWRGCADKSCQRAKSCRRSDSACLTAFMQAMPDENRRVTRYALENRRNGLDPDEALQRAQARIDDEIARSPDPGRSGARKRPALGLAPVRRGRP